MSGWTLSVVISLASSVVVLLWWWFVLRRTRALLRHRRQLIDEFEARVDAIGGMSHRAVQLGCTDTKAGRPSEAPGAATELEVPMQANPTVKAIETRYRGYRFRSRLEARWAVFFDAIGEPWEYEVEGFNPEDNVYYLPDFWLPRVGWFAEVKPSDDLDRYGNPDYRSETWRKIFSFVEADAFDQRRGVILLAGTPEDREYWGCQWTETDGSMGFCTEPRRIVRDDESGALEFVSDYCIEGRHRRVPRRCFDAARSARFEFGR